MAYPVNTFPTFNDLANYINTNWVTNGMEEIDAVIGNDVVNGLLTFIEQSPLNWQTAQVISTGGIITTTRPIAVFITNTPTSLAWADNIYNQYVFINTTGNAMPLATGFHYYDINLVAKSTIPSKTIVSIAKASNGLWISIYNSSSSGSGSFTQIADTIGTTGTTYTNAALVGASELKWCMVDKQNFTEIDGDFDFDPVTGTLTFNAITLYVGSTIIIPYKD